MVAPDLEKEKRSRQSWNTAGQTPTKTEGPGPLTSSFRISSFHMSSTQALAGL